MVEPNPLSRFGTDLQEIIKLNSHTEIATYLSE